MSGDPSLNQQSSYRLSSSHVNAGHVNAGHVNAGFQAPEQSPHQLRAEGRLASSFEHGAQFGPGLRRGAEPQFGGQSRQEAPTPFDALSLRERHQAEGDELALLPPALPEAATGKEQPAPPSYRDKQISELFTAMGQAANMATEQLAQRLQTRASLIRALEEGAMDQLPEWEEISAVVAQYAHFMNIDERPILRRLREKITEYYLTSLTHKPLELDEDTFSFAPRAQDHFHMAEGEKSSAEPLKVKRQQGFGADQGRERASFKSAVGAHGGAEIGDVASSGRAFGSSDFSSRLQQSKDQANQKLNGLKLNSLKVGDLNRAAEYKQTSYQQNGYSQQPGDYGAPSSHQDYGYYADIPPKKGFPFLKVAANLAFVLILLFGFVQWQPNRFWSGVDQLPKPISETIYNLFEFVMPDPLASTYRMNWVFVDDPRLRKSDKLPLPKLKSINPIDFSSLGSFQR